MVTVAIFDWTEPEWTNQNSTHIRPITYCYINSKYSSMSDQYTAIANLPSLSCRLFRKSPQRIASASNTINVVGKIELPDLRLEERLVANNDLDSLPSITHASTISSVPREYIEESKELFEDSNDQEQYIQKLAMLVEMGFDIEQASRVLLECHLQEEEAIERLLHHLTL